MARLLVSVFLLQGLALVAACVPDAPDPGAGRRMAQTLLPGHIAAGGGTSGAVMASSAPEPSKDMGAASQQAGTPGIPQGAGGNTSGTEMGGTTGTSAIANSGEQTNTQRTPGEPAPAHAADTNTAAAPREATPASAAAVAAATAAEQERLLDERMTRVAQRWQQRARQSGRPVSAPPPASTQESFRPSTPNAAATPPAAAR